MAAENSPTSPGKDEARGELLAPAGGPEAAYAALHYGADAVYLGLRRFSARAEAVNFDLAELDAVVAFAHAQTPRRRVFATFNTVTLDAELPGVIDALARAVDIGVDAVIVQDLGVARLVRQQFPRLEMHASTQMAIHSLAGARELRKLGFSRVALARELTLDEVRRISAEAGIETEVFIHGALCYAYSGLCLLSSHLCGRSGNRGRCAYPCRDVFSWAADGPVAGGAGRSPRPTEADGQGLLFSMKDLALPDAVCELRRAGVVCFKIEGRMKSALYVAAVTDFYRRILDGRMAAADLPQAAADLRTIFSRPWSELYLRGNRHTDVVDTQWVGHRGVAVGQVEKIYRPPREGPVLRFKTARALELHDGLQIDLPGEPRPFGFAVNELRLAAGTPQRSQKPLFSVPAGTLVDVPLPPDCPHLPAGAGIYCASSQAVKQAFSFTMPKAGLYRQRRPFNVEVEVTPAAVAARASVTPAFTAAPAATVTAEIGGTFTAARNPDGLEAAARVAFEKLGDTSFTLADFALRNPQNLFVPVSQLNELRRQVTAALEAELQRGLDVAIAATQARALAPPAAGAREPVAERWSLQVDDPACLAAFAPADWADVSELVLDIGRLPLATLEAALAPLARAAGCDRLRLALPLITRAWDEPELRQKLARLAAAGWSRWQAANLSAWSYLRDEVTPRLGPATLDITTDWTLFVMNRLAAWDLGERGVAGVTLSPEDGLNNLQALLPSCAAMATMVVYQDTPLFVSESCGFAARRGGCAGPGRCEVRNCARAALPVRSSRGEEYLMSSEGCRTVVVKGEAFCLSTRLAELRAAGARRFRVDFCHRAYAPEVALGLWRRVRQGLPVPHTHEGNYRRGI